MSELTKRWFYAYQVFWVGRYGNETDIKSGISKGEHPLVTIQRMNEGNVQGRTYIRNLIFYKEMTEEEYAYLEASLKQYEEEKSCKIPNH